MTLPEEAEETSLDRPPPADSLHCTRLRWLIGAFYVLSAVFVVVAIASTVDRAEGRVIPSLPAIGFSLVALMLALRCLASAWASLLPGEAAPVELRCCVYSSQLGKYVPGGVVQGVGQVAIARRMGIPLRTAFPAYVVFAGHAAFGSIAVGVVLTTQAPAVGTGWALAAAVLGLVAIATAWRRVLDALLRLAQRVAPRLRRVGPLPSQPALTRGFVLQIAFALLQGASFAALLGSLDHDVPVVAAIGANALAFGLGLLALPVPSGLVVREGLLVAILHPVAGAATVVTAAVVQRLAAIAAEGLMLVANRFASRPSPRGSGDRRPEGSTMSTTTPKTKYHGLLSPYLRNRRLAMARPLLSGRVLDVGCAEGHLAGSVAPTDYVGVDLDQGILAEARRAHPEHLFVGLDDLDKGERFDTVVALAVIEHVLDPEGWLRRWAGHLVPGGQVVVTTPYDRYEPVHGIAARLRLTSDEAHDEHETTFDRESLGQVFESAGLTLTTYKRFLLGLNQLAVGTLE